MVPGSRQEKRTDHHNQSFSLGANDGARTRDIRDHNPTLYLLSYVRLVDAGSYASSSVSQNKFCSTKQLSYRRVSSQQPKRSTSLPGLACWVVVQQG